MVVMTLAQPKKKENCAKSEISLYGHYPRVNRVCYILLAIRKVDFAKINGLSSKTVLVSELCLESSVRCAGFGVEQLRDGSLDTYWQSDGPQPHLVNIQFHRKMTIPAICIYADYKADESYTPSR